MWWHMYCFVVWLRSSCIVLPWLLVKMAAAVMHNRSYRSYSSIHGDDHTPVCQDPNLLHASKYQQQPRSGCHGYRRHSTAYQSRPKDQNRKHHSTHHQSGGYRANYSSFLGNQKNRPVSLSCSSFANSRNSLGSYYQQQVCHASLMSLNAQSEVSVGSTGHWYTSGAPRVYRRRISLPVGVPINPYWCKCVFLGNYTCMYLK